jgi:hypothetical protein
MRIYSNHDYKSRTVFVYKHYKIKYIKIIRLIYSNISKACVRLNADCGN